MFAAREARPGIFACTRVSFGMQPQNARRLQPTLRPVMPAISVGLGAFLDLDIGIQDMTCNCWLPVLTRPWAVECGIQ